MCRSLKSQTGLFLSLLVLGHRLRAILSPLFTFPIE